MRQSSLVLVGAMVATATAAHADSFGGWQYKPPKGYAIQATDDHVAFTKTTTAAVCSIALFKVRATDDTPANESATEWKNVVETNFTVANKRSGTSTTTKHGIGIAQTSAAVTDSDGNKFAAIHYVVTSPGMISSILLTSTDGSLKKCEPIATTLIASLAVDETFALAPADPEARVETPLGRWASRAEDNTKVSTSHPVAEATLREYTLTDGAYTFHSEVTGGKLKPEELRIVDETGTYTLKGNQLTLVPAKATAVLRESGAAKPATKLAHEKVTYTWSKRYVAGTNEWQLVLMPAKKTTRDGEPDANASYVYSDHFKPEWPSQKPAAEPTPEPAE